MTLCIRLKRIGPIEVEIPKYQTVGSAGFDLSAAIAEPILLLPRMRCLIPTGLAMAIPQGYEGQVRPRSGLALRHGLAVVNAPGTIDSDYRGEVAVVLINHGQEPYTVLPLIRIAQLVVSRVERASLALVVELDDTERGAGGYGSTGG
jgi:dUTP pyrophosphatase